MLGRRLLRPECQLTRRSFWLDPVGICERNKPSLAEAGHDRQRPGRHGDDSGKPRVALPPQQPRAEVGRDGSKTGQWSAEQGQFLDEAGRVEPE